MNAPEELIGRAIRCPVCNGMIPVRYHEPVRPPASLVSPETEGPATLFALRCPSCGAGAVENAVLCVDCGYDFRTGQRLKPETERLNNRFDWLLPLKVRFLLWIGVAAVLTAALAVGEIRGLTWEVFAIALPLSAFLLGTFSRISADTDGYGTAQIRRTFFLAFLPLPTATYRADEIVGLYSSYAEGSDPKARLLALLLAALGFLPGAVWWLFFCRYDTYMLYVLLHGRGKFVRLYRGTSETTFRQVVAMVQRLADVPCERY